MKAIESAGISVKCPHCGNRFSPEEALGHDLRVQLEQEFRQQLTENLRSAEARIREQEKEKYMSELAVLREETKIRAERLQQAEREALKLRELEQKLVFREENLELEMKRRLLEREKLIREEADKVAVEKALVQMREKEQKLEWERERLEVILRKRVQEEAEKVRQEEQLRSAELQKKLDDQHRLINEMRRKSEQGSMQMQGEVQELAIEDFLRINFPRDVVEEVAKGKRGGDCVHIIRDQFNRVCGRILFESKRTRHFSYDWITKVKDDMRLRQAEIGVIVTEALPEGVTRFTEVDGVWVCTFPEFKALAFLLRAMVLRMGENVAAQENRGEKSELIYAYVTGVEFRQKLEAAFEAWSEMQEDLVREKTVMMAQWGKREKRLIRAMENLVALYGDVRGIAGGAVPEIAALEVSYLSGCEE